MRIIGKRMKQKTKRRIIVACLGIPLSTLTAFMGAGLTGWALYIHEYGMRPPEVFGWIGIFIISGLVALIAAGPALLVMITLSIVRCMPLGKHAILSIFLPLSLGAIAIVISFNMSPISRSSFIVSGATCLAIVVVVELLLRKKW